MFGWLDKIRKRIKELNGTVDNYKQETIIQSLPTVAYVNRAKKLIEKKKYDEAEEILTQALDISTQDARVYKYLGKINEYRKNFKEAIDNYRVSSKLNPQDKEIWIRLGMCLLNTEMYIDAIEAYEKANKVTPYNTDVFTGWGMTLMKQKKYALARDKFIEASKFNKYNFTALLLSAIMEIRLREYDSAEVKLRFLASVAPTESSTYEYANLKLIKGDYKEAEIYAKRALEINKQMLPAYFVLGEIYSLKHDFEKTQEVYETAVENYLDNEALYVEWGKSFVRFFDFEKAKEKFDIAKSKVEDYEEAIVGHILTSAYLEDFSLLDEERIAKYGKYSYIQEAIGLELFSKGFYHDAIEKFKKSLEIDEKETYNYLNLARTYKVLENKDKIRDNYEKFTQENPWYLSGLLEYSKWLFSIEDWAEAQRKLRKAEKIAPENIEILNMLFFVSYRLVKENVCEYNVKETISLAQKIESLGEFRYNLEKSELESLLINIQQGNM